MSINTGITEKLFKMCKKGFLVSKHIYISINKTQITYTVIVLQHLNDSRGFCKYLFSTTAARHTAVHKFYNKINGFLVFQDALPFINTIKFEIVLKVTELYLDQ